MQHSSRSNFVRGALYGLSPVSISALDGGARGVRPQRYCKVFEFAVPTLVAPNGGADQKDAELACSISNVRI